MESSGHPRGKGPGTGQRLPEALRSLYVAGGGAWGQEAPARSRKIGGQHPPTTSRMSSAATSMSPGLTRQKTRGRRRQETSGAAGGSCKRRSRRSSPPTRPRGACEVWRVFFPSGFPHHVEDLGPSHHFARIPTACGAASAAAALPRIVTAGGGGRTGSYGVNRGDTSTDTECMRQG